MLSSTGGKNLSLTGTWGAERNQPTYERNTNHMKTTATATYNLDAQQSLNEQNSNEFAKFKHLKDAGFPILSMSSVRTPDDHMSLNTDESQDNSSASLLRTLHARRRSINAPVAVGRSGVRVEKGTSTSGLIGERLQLIDEPRVNSLVQRSWMYVNDPSLEYKMHGVPVADMPSDVSLAIGNPDKKANSPPKVIARGQFARTNIFTGHGALSKSGSRVFMDDPI